jgi:hypothetical protein
VTGKNDKRHQERVPVTGSDWSGLLSPAVIGEREKKQGNWK